MNMITPLEIFAYFLFWLGFSVWLSGTVTFLATVFRSSVAWFLGCLLVPLADVIYFFLNVRQTWKSMLMMVAGLLIATFGCWLGGFDFLPH